jgi:hypothetical protein
MIYCTTSVTVLDCTSAPEVPVIPTWYVPAGVAAFGAGGGAGDGDPLPPHDSCTIVMATATGTRNAAEIVR